MTKAMMVFGIAAVLAAGCSQTGAPQPAETAGSQAAPAPGAAALPPGDAAAASSASQAPAGVAPASMPATSGAPAGTAAPSVASAGTPAAAPAPSAPPAPKFKEVTVPAGTRLSIKLATAIASDTSKVEDPVRGTIARAVQVGGAVAVPAGAQIIGNVVEAEDSGRVKGRARVAFRFNRLTISDEGHEIRTELVAREAESSTKDDVKKGGIGAGAGAIVGGIVGGGKGAAIGAGVGGAGAVMGTKGKEVQLAAGETVTATLQSDLTVLVPIEP